MLLSSHYNEKHSLLILQFGGVFAGAEAMRAAAEFISAQKVLPRYSILDYREVTTADLVDTDTALQSHVLRSLPFPARQVHASRFVHLLPADPNHPLWKRFRSIEASRVLLAQRTLLAASDDPEHDWQEALSLLDLPSTIARPY